MRTFLASSGLTLGSLALALAAAALSTLVPGRADAHFILDKAPDGGTMQGEPACYSEQAADGTPEKSAPCGQDDTGIPVVPTNIVTSFTPGADGTTTITITTNEVVFHPGHYRIAIASDMNSLPADPAVTAGSTACGSAVIETVAAGTVSSDGVLADDVLDHTTAFSSPQSYTFKVPGSVHCSPQCVLQVVEFMSDHPLNPQGGCFYHHCANISIASSQPDDGGTEESDAGRAASGSSSGTSGSTTSGVSGTASSGTGASGTASSGAAGSGSGSSGGTGSATGGSSGTASTGTGASSGAASAGSAGTASPGTTGSGPSGSGSAGAASTEAASGGSSSPGGCAVATGLGGDTAPGAQLGALAVAALVFLRRRVARRAVL
ncbi:MAG TPA: SCE4755 family polysaccharide monooxygenase-like protein [Polyangiaceae bacterium]|nr:SCE4755 family polysaccharide monooxygenase-like protein [Polyangiaceae bacterium]